MTNIEIWGVKGTVEKIEINGLQFLPSEPIIKVEGKDPYWAIETKSQIVITTEPIRIIMKKEVENAN